MVKPGASRHVLLVLFLQILEELRKTATWLSQRQIFTLFHFYDSVLTHILVFQLERKIKEISKRCTNKTCCLIKVRNAFIVQELLSVIKVVIFV